MMDLSQSSPRQRRPTGTATTVLVAVCICATAALLLWGNHFSILLSANVTSSLSSTTKAATAALKTAHALRKDSSSSRQLSGDDVNQKTLAGEESEVASDENPPQRRQEQKQRGEEEDESDDNFVYDFFRDVLLVVVTTPKRLSSVPRARAALEPYFRHIVFTRGNDNSDLPAHVRGMGDPPTTFDAAKDKRIEEWPSTDSSKDNKDTNSIQKRQYSHCSSSTGTTSSSSSGSSNLLPETGGSSRSSSSSSTIVNNNIAADLIVDWTRSCDPEHRNIGLRRGSSRGSRRSRSRNSCLCFPGDAICTEAVPLLSSSRQQPRKNSFSLEGGGDSDSGGGALAVQQLLWRNASFSSLNEAFLKGRGGTTKRNARTKKSDAEVADTKGQEGATNDDDDKSNKDWFPATHLRLEKRGCGGDASSVGGHAEGGGQANTHCSETVISVPTPLDTPPPTNPNPSLSEKLFTQAVMRRIGRQQQLKKRTHEAAANAQLLAADPLVAWNEKILPALQEEARQTREYTNVLDEYDIAAKGPGHRQMGLAQNLAPTEIMARVLTLERLARDGHLSYHLRPLDSSSVSASSVNAAVVAVPSTPHTPPLAEVRRFAPWLWAGGPCASLTSPFYDEKTTNEATATASTRSTNEQRASSERGSATPSSATPVPLPLPTLRGVFVLADDIVLFPWDLALRGLRKDVPWMMPPAVGANQRLFQYMDTLRAQQERDRRKSTEQRQSQQPPESPVSQPQPPPRLPECTADVVSDFFMPDAFATTRDEQGATTDAIRRRARTYVDHMLVRGGGLLGPLYSFWRTQTVHSRENVLQVLPLPAGAPPLTTLTTTNSSASSSSFSSVVAAAALAVPYRAWNNVNSGQARSTIGVASFGIPQSLYPDLQCVLQSTSSGGSSSSSNRTRGQRWRGNDSRRRLVEAIAADASLAAAAAVSSPSSCADSDSDKRRSGGGGVAPQSAVVCAIPTTQSALRVLPLQSDEMTAVADAAANTLCALARRGIKNKRRSSRQQSSSSDSGASSFEGGGDDTIEAYYRRQLKIPLPPTLPTTSSSSSLGPYLLETSRVRVALAQAADVDGGRSSADGRFGMTLPPLSGPEVAEAAAETPLQQFAETYNFGADPSLLLQDVTRALQHIETEKEKDREKTTPPQQEAAEQRNIDKNGKGKGEGDGIEIDVGVKEAALQRLLPVPVPADALASTVHFAIADAYYVPRALWGGMILLSDLFAAAGPGAVHHEVGTPTQLRWLAAAQQRRRRLEEREQQKAAQQMNKKAEDQAGGEGKVVSRAGDTVDRGGVWRRAGAVLRSAHPRTFEALHVVFACFQPSADGCERPPGLLVCPQAPAPPPPHAAAPAHLLARLHTVAAAAQPSAHDGGFAEGWAVAGSSANDMSSGRGSGGRSGKRRGGAGSSSRNNDNNNAAGRPEDRTYVGGDPLAPATISGYHRCRLDHPFQALLRRRMTLPSTAALRALLLLPPPSPQTEEEMKKKKKPLQPTESSSSEESGSGASATPAGDVVAAVDVDACSSTSSLSSSAMHRLPLRRAEGILRAYEALGCSPRVENRKEEEEENRLDVSVEDNNKNNDNNYSGGGGGDDSDERLLGPDWRRGHDASPFCSPFPVLGRRHAGTWTAV